MRDKDSILLESSYYQILEEGRKWRYMEMFKKFIKSADNIPLKEADQLYNDILYFISKTIEILKKEEIIVWFLKLFRKGLLGMVKMSGSNIPKIQDSYYKYTKHSLEYLEQFRHFLSLPIPKIQNYDYNKWTKDIDSPRVNLFLTAGEVLNEFRTYEQNWAHQQKQWIDITNELKKNEIEPIVEFNNGLSWFNLKRPYCKDEGAAMGHCGNCAGRESDNILSLRQIKKEGDRILARPSLTFILQGDGSLGEMKGRSNNKPQEKYHSYILSLLKAKVGGEYLVKNIRGGGYLPESNFDLEDLSDENLEALFKNRPELYSNPLTVAERFLKNKGEIPEYMLKNLMFSESAITIAKTLAHDYIRRGIKIPEILLEKIAMGSSASYWIARELIERNKKIPEILFMGMSEDLDFLSGIVYRLKERNMEIPDKVLKMLQGY